MDVIIAGLTVPSAVLLLESPMLTFAVGFRLRTTVNVAMSPPSLVFKPLTGLTVMPAES